jgi:TPR repeat protein
MTVHARTSRPLFLLLCIMGVAVTTVGQTNLNARDASNVRGASESELILVYANGSSLPQASQREAFAKAANFGDPLAQVNLGVLYAMGAGSSARRRKNPWMP